jgi:bacteriorhodopsin
MANIVQGQSQMQKPMAMNSGGAGGAKMGMTAEPKKSKKWLWWTIGIVALVIIIGLIWWLMA